MALDETLAASQGVRAAADAAADAKGARSDADFDELPAVDPKNYAFLGEVARGGMGRIVAARDRRVGRPVAVKEILSKSPAAAARLEREARITARLQHPAIVPLYEAGHWPGGEPFYAMKLVEGRSLDKVIAETGSSSERLALLGNVIAVADALAYAHGKNVIHRDLKPANVLVGEYGETVVIDWGLAKDLDAAALVESELAPTEPLDDDLTRPGAAMGTPAYMPPEQARGERVDARADVYSLGAMLYHLLSGQVPYRDSQSGRDAVARVLAGPPTPLHEKVADAPADLVTIVEKAMARSPGDRYATAKELAEDLHRFQTGQLVGAHRYTLGALLGRWIARHRGAVAIGAAAAVVLAAVGVVSVRRIARARDRAEASQAVAEAQRAAAERNSAEALLEGARAALGRNDLLEARAKLRSSLEIEDSLPARALWTELAELELVWLRQLPGYVSDLAMSPDGQTIAAVCGTPGIYLLDAHTAAFRTFRNSGGTVHSVAFTPDGSHLVAGTDDGLVQIWTVDGELSARLEGHSGAVTSLDISRDGLTIVSGSDDGTIRIWDRASGTTRIAIDAPRQHWPVRLTPDGKTIASGSTIGALFFWNADTGSLRSRLEIGRSDILAITIDPDGKTLFAGTDSAGTHVVDVSEAEVVAALGRSATIGAVAISADRRRVVLAGSGWADLHTRLAGGGWSDPRGLLADPTSGVITDAAFGPDGAHLATAATDGTVRLWNTAHPGSRRRSFGHDGDVHDVAISPDGLLLASSGMDGVVGLWLTETGHWVRAWRRHDDAVERLAFSSDGRYLASGDDAGIVYLWAIHATKPHRILQTDIGTVWGLDFHPDGRTLATSSFAGVRTWDVTTGGLLGTFHTTFAADVAYGPRGDQLAAYSGDGTVRVFDAKSGKTLRTFDDVGSLWQVGLDYAPRSDRIAFSGSADGTLWLGNSDTGELRTIAVPRSQVYRVAFHPDGRRVGTAHKDGTAAIVDLSSGEIVRLRGHLGPVRSIRFSADGRLAVTAGHDDTVRVWDVASARPYWRTSAAVPLPDGTPRVHTHQGWHVPGNTSSETPPSDEHLRQALEWTAQAVTSQDAARACARTWDDHLEVWDLSRNALVARTELRGLSWVEATDRGCACLHDGVLERVAPDGTLARVAEGVDAVAWVDGELLAARGSALDVLDASGNRVGSYEVPRGATAVSRVGKTIALGFDDGVVRLVPMGAGASYQLASDDMTASPVVRLLPGPAGTLIAGHANGRLCIWDVARSRLIDHRKLHGPASYLWNYGQTLYAATELGDHLSWDLSVYSDAFCELLAEVRRDIPVVWSDGRTTRANPTAHAACP